MILHAPCGFGKTTLVNEVLCDRCEKILKISADRILDGIRDPDKSREGAYLTVCAPDVDNDSMLLKFKGSETYYSKPEVQAIMQSAPYFRDVADVYDDYLNNSATTYGKSESDSKSVSASIEVSLGAYISAEVFLRFR